MDAKTNRLAGKAAIVTGAASGIGKATAWALAREGAAVILADIDESGAGKVAREISTAGGRAIGFGADIAEERDIQNMIMASVSHFGRLDILHNNAVASSPQIIGRDIDVVSMDAEIWDRTMRINLRGPMLACKYALPEMIKGGGGSIINMSSASGLTGDLARPAYGASKAAINALTLSVATLHGKQGIRCNSIAPGVIDTPALRANIAAQDLAMYERNHLTPRMGRPEDIAEMVVFLASDAAAFITGQVISVDGGLLSHHPVLGEILARRG